MTPDPHEVQGPDKQASATWPNAIPKWVGVGLFLYLTIFALGFAQLFLVPVVLTFLLSMVFSPIRRFMNRCGISQGLSATAIIFTLLASLALIAGALAIPVSDWVNNAPQIERKLEIRLNEVSGPFSGFFEPASFIRVPNESVEPRGCRYRPTSTSCGRLVTGLPNTRLGFWPAFL